MAVSERSRRGVRGLRQTRHDAGATMDRMKTAILLVNLGVAALAAGTLVYAAVDNAPRATLMSEHDYSAALKSIDNEARTSAIVCKRLSGYEMSVCAAERAAEKGRDHMI